MGLVAGASAAAAARGDVDAEGAVRRANERHALAAASDQASDVGAGSAAVVVAADGADDEGGDGAFGGSLVVVAAAVEYASEVADERVASFGGGPSFALRAELPVPCDPWTVAATAAGADESGGGRWASCGCHHRKGCWPPRCAHPGRSMRPALAFFCHPVWS